MPLAVGLEYLRAGTEAFIATSAVELTLQPVADTQPDGTGGQVPVPGDPRAPQTFGLFEPGGGGFGRPDVTPVGQQTLLDFWLIGTYDAVIAEGDTFDYGGYTYKVETLLPDNGYERRATAVRVG